MIPKVIWQISEHEYDDLPFYIKELTNTWKRHNPDWDYRYVTNSMASKLLKTYTGELNKKVYDGISTPFVKADFFRYIILYAFGGVYVDIDTACTSPIENWMPLDGDLSVSKSDNFDIFGEDTYDQWVIGSTPKNKYIEKAMSEIRHNLLELPSLDMATPASTNNLEFTKAIKQIEDQSGIRLIKDSSPETPIHYSAYYRWSDKNQTRHLRDYQAWDSLSGIDIKIMSNEYNSGLPHVS